MFLQTTSRIVFFVFITPTPTPTGDCDFGGPPELHSFSQTLSCRHLTEKALYKGGDGRYSRGVSIGDALDVACRMMDANCTAGNSIRGIKSELVSLELVGDCVGDVKQKDIRLAVIEEELCPLDTTFVQPSLGICSVQQHTGN